MVSEFHDLVEENGRRTPKNTWTGITVLVWTVISLKLGIPSGNVGVYIYWIQIDNGLNSQLTFLINIEFTNQQISCRIALKDQDRRFDLSISWIHVR